jgi:uncharacterized surface protein with fasciclin (FAS1) repeats
MRLRNAVALVSTLALGAGAVLATAPAASAAQGNRSLAKVLTSDGNRFDKKAGDFDIATEAVLAVVKAKPGSPVAVLADGKTRVTAFVPTDRAFKALVFDLTGTWYYKEKQAFNAAASLGIDTIETVLLYHVVAGKTLTAAKVLDADGASVATAQGGSVTVDVLDPTRGVVRLQDADPDDVDPTTIPRLLNLNKGNKQIAHGIDYVLRPVDL